MRKAFIVKGIAEQYRKLLANTVFVFLGSHWFISFDETEPDIYIIRIKDGHNDIEYALQKFGENFEVVTDNKEIATLLYEINDLFDHIDPDALKQFNEEGTHKDVEIFKSCNLINDVELDTDNNFKVYLKS
ncbi:hypothetical protein AAD001_10910 [Colwelliaceae bacterium 6471]